MKKYLSQFFVARSKKYSRKSLYEVLIESLKIFPTGAQVLNVGSGGEIERRLRAALKEINPTAQVLSLDIDPDRKPDVLGDLCHTNFKAEQFDAVCVMEVLEHVESPWEAVAEIKRILKSGGTVVVSVPFVFPIHDRPHDYYRFTRYGLELLFKDFESCQVKARNSYAEAVMTLLIRLYVEKSFFSKFVGMLMILLFAPVLIFLLNRMIHSDAVTTGYTLIAKKKG